MGASAQLSAGGADTYAWSSGQSFAVITVTANANTVYTVTGTASQNGITCSGTNTISVNVNPNPTVTASSSRTAMCISESNVINGNGATSYTWSTPSGPLSGASITVSPVTDQSYTLTGVDANGCKGTGTFQLKVTACVGIESHTLSQTRLVIYPNPSSGEFTISSNTDVKLRIVNELGQEVRQISLSADADTLVNGLANGIYFITGGTAGDGIKEKIIITK
jgi:hypothetical protein